MPSAGQAVLRYFESVQSTNPEAFLQQLRPGLPSAAYRRMVIDTLPQQGNLVPTWREIAKLSSIRPIVAYHGLGQDFELRVVMLRGEAFIGLHARSVLLITRETLDLVDELQLQALVAHEARPRLRLGAVRGGEKASRRQSDPAIGAVVRRHCGHRAASSLRRSGALDIGGHRCHATQRTPRCQRTSEQVRAATRTRALHPSDRETDRRALASTPAVTTPVRFFAAAAFPSHGGRNDPESQCLSGGCGHRRRLISTCG